MCLLTAIRTVANYKSSHTKEKWPPFHFGFILMRKTTTHTASYTHIHSQTKHKQNTNNWKCDSLNSSPASQPTSLNDEILSTNWMWIRRVNAENVHYSPSVEMALVVLCANFLLRSMKNESNTYTQAAFQFRHGRILQIESFYSGKLLLFWICTFCGSQEDVNESR